MTEPTERGDEGRAESAWLLEPPRPGEVRLHVAIGDDTQLSPEVRSALEALVGQVHEAEVEGFGVKAPPGCSTLSCPEYGMCSDFSCWPLGKCGILWKSPCKVHTGCSIADFR